MDDNHVNELLTAAYPNEKTRATYRSRLNALKTNLPDISLFALLTEPDTHYSALQQAYPSITTRKNMLTVFLALFREDKAFAEAHTNAYNRWRKLHEDLTRHEKVKVKRSEPENKQIEKYTSYEEIEKKYIDLKKRAPHGTQRTSMQFLLISIIVHLRPKRADLGNVRIYYENDPRFTDANYIVLRKKGSSYLVMNVYKTSKYYETVEEDLKHGLVEDIQTSLRRWPRTYLFQTEDGKPMSNNTYSVFVKRTFEEYFGRSTGVSLLRHIYITEKLDFDNMTLGEQEEEAKLMLHTSNLQRAYKWPKKVICPKLCAAYIQPVKRTRKIKRKTKRETV